MPPEETAVSTARVPANACEKKQRKNWRMRKLRTEWNGRQVEFGAREVDGFGPADKKTFDNCIAAPQICLQGRKPRGHIGLIRLDLELTNGI
jgi:hypothetical protein